MDAFKNHKYLNLETYRKTGRGVKTPVWFAQHENAFFVWTFYDSGKAKRIRRHGQVKIVPSTVSGEPLGEWVHAQATADASPQAIQHVSHLMRAKYGLAFILFRVLGRLRKTKITTLQIQITT
jgi:PPOX class probable F420-dependent enzyme